MTFISSNIIIISLDCYCIHPLVYIIYFIYYFLFFLLFLWHYVKSFIRKKDNKYDISHTPA